MQQWSVLWQKLLRQEKMMTWWQPRILMPEEIFFCVFAAKTAICKIFREIL